MNIPLSGTAGGRIPGLCIFPIWGKGQDKGETIYHEKGEWIVLEYSVIANPDPFPSYLML